MLKETLRIGVGEMVAKNSIIDINVHGEMVKCCDYQMVQYCNGETIKSLLINVNVVRSQLNILFAKKRL